MDHLHISDNETSSVILRQTVVSKVENVESKVPKQAYYAKWECVINPLHDILNQLVLRKI